MKEFLCVLRDQFDSKCWRLRLCCGLDAIVCNVSCVIGVAGQFVSIDFAVFVKVGQ